MEISSSSPRKVCVFASYERQGGANLLMASYLRAIADQGFSTVLVQTCEDNPDAAAYRAVERWCQKILVRPNIGYDFVSWKVGLDFVAKDLDQCEKLLLTNDSIAGPFVGLKPIFARLDGEPSALWGLTDCAETGKQHLQSYFIYADRQVFSSDFFQTFWRNVTVLPEKWRIITEYEVGLSQAALAAGVPLKAVFDYEGVKAKALAKAGDFQYFNDIRKAPLNPTLFCWDILLELGYPFIKTELLRDNRIGSRHLAKWKSFVSDHDSAGFEAARDYEERHAWMIPERREPSANLRELKSVLPMHLVNRWRSKLAHRYRQASGLVRDLLSLDYTLIVRKLSKILGRNQYVQKWLAQDLSRAARERYFEEARRELNSFYFSGARLQMPESAEAQITIVLNLFNKAELTYRCLVSLAALTSDARFKLLIIDNASSDDTRRLLQRVDGAEVHLNESNVGFLKACNQASKFVTTKYMLFLNNDTILYAGSLAAATECLRQEKVGAVGGRIVLPSGHLQEAGNIIWNDGTCVGYARGLDMTAEEAMFRRDVDYCSGVFLMTHTDLYQAMGGFDEDYFPAYYEETDYCVRLAKSGYRVVYDPRILVKHVEFGSAGDGSAAFSLMNTNRQKFQAKHRDYLSKQPAPGASLSVTRTSNKRKRILFLDDRAALPSWGAGYPRANFIIKSILASGEYSCTIGCQEYFETDWSKVYSDIPLEVEICDLSWQHKRDRFFRERLNDFDFVWVSRPTSFRNLIASVGEQALRARKFFLIYDSEAIFGERAVVEAELFGLSTRRAEAELAAELAVAEFTDLTLSVCEADAAKWKQASGRDVLVLGFDIALTRSQTPYHQRQHILFLGALHGMLSPNADSLAWFMGEVAPYVRDMLPGVEVHAVGFVDPAVKSHLSRELRNFKLIGAVSDLGSVFEKYRLMIVPTRYAAGIPQKVFDAAVRGMPTVCSPLIAKQMLWQNEQETLIGDTKNPQAFADACRRLYLDQELWQAISDRSFAAMEKYKATHDLQIGINKVLEVMRKARARSPEKAVASAITNGVVQQL
jgi:GT2 family glycosyltransferase/glycosyltransferase involved in cell wall biosynthesis